LTQAFAEGLYLLQEFGFCKLAGRQHIDLHGLDKHACLIDVACNKMSQLRALTPNGNVRYQLKTPYRDGTPHVIVEPLDFIARLAALVPKPRVNLTRFHGVFAPRSLSDLGLIYCAGGRAAHSSPISRYIAPQIASKTENSVLALPPCSLRSPKSDRLLAADTARG
jgi:hypothetical protein